MVSLNKIEKKVGEKVILHIEQLEFGNCGFHVILGESGAGKSTLLNIIGGMDCDYSGEVKYDDRIIEAKDFSNLRKRKVSYIFQELNLLENLSVKKNILIALKISGIEWDEDEYLRVLKKVGLEDKSENLIKNLSGGEKQRVAIARALLKNSDVILADEPTGNLDSENADNIFKILSQIAENKNVILVTHDRKLAYKYATDIIEIHSGQIKKTEHRIISGKSEDQSMVQKNNHKYRFCFLEYAINGVIKNIKKNTAMLIALGMLIACVSLILGVYHTINGMYHNLNTTILENDKYQIMNETEENICYNRISNDFVKEIMQKEYINYSMTYYETKLETETLDKKKSKIEYTVVDDSNFFKDRYNVEGQSIKNEKEVIVNRQFAETAFGSEDIVGKTVRIGEIGSEYKISCKIIGVLSENVEDGISRVYLSHKLIDKIAENKIDDWIYVSTDYSVENGNFCSISEYSKEDKILYGENLKEENEIVIDAQSVSAILEQEGYSYRYEEILKGNLPSDLQEKILNKEIIIYKNCSVLSTGKIVGIIDREEEANGTIFLYSSREYIEAIKKNNNFHTVVYLNDLSKECISDLESLCEKYGYTVRNENSATINSLMSRMTIIVLAFSAVGVVLAIAAIVIIYAMTKLDIYARMYEIGVLKTLGASNIEIFKILVLNNLILGCVSSIFVIFIFVMLDITNIDKRINISGYPIYQSSTSQYIWILVFGMLIPVMSGLPSICNASKIAAKKALKVNL